MLLQPRRHETKRLLGPVHERDKLCGPPVSILSDTTLVTEDVIRKGSGDHYLFIGRTEHHGKIL